MLCGRAFPGASGLAKSGAAHTAADVRNRQQKRPERQRISGSEHAGRDRDAACDLFALRAGATATPGNVTIAKEPYAGDGAGVFALRTDRRICGDEWGMADQFGHDYHGRSGLHARRGGGRRRSGLQDTGATPGSNGCRGVRHCVALFRLVELNSRRDGWAGDYRGLPAHTVPDLSAEVDYGDPGDRGDRSRAVAAEDHRAVAGGVELHAAGGADPAADFDEPLECHVGVCFGAADTDCRLGFGGRHCDLECGPAGAAGDGLNPPESFELRVLTAKQKARLDHRGGPSGLEVSGDGLRVLRHALPARGEEPQRGVGVPVAELLHAVLVQAGALQREAGARGAALPCAVPGRVAGFLRAAAVAGGELPYAAVVGEQHAAGPLAGVAAWAECGWSESPGGWAGRPRGVPVAERG